MRVVICLVLVFWLSSVSAAALAAYWPESALSVARTYDAIRPWLLMLPVWLTLPVGRPAKLAGTGLWAAQVACAARDLNGFHNLLLPTLLGLLMATVLGQRLKGASNFRRGNADDC